MSRFIDAIVKAKTFELAQAMFIIYGFEISDEAMTLIEAHFAQKEENAAMFAEQVQPPTQYAGTDTQEPEVEDEPVRKIDLQQVGRELSLWQSKCLKALKRGEPAEAVPFVPVSIPDDIYAKIAAGLVGISNPDELKALFVGAMRQEAEPEAVKAQPDMLAQLVGELKRQNDIFIWKGYP
jgi:hypothetical protein